MRIIFELRFHTEPGQSLLLTGNHELVGNGDMSRALPLQYFNDEAWRGTLTFAPGTAPDVEITYHYVLREADGSLTHDWGEDRVLNPARCGDGELLIIDAWNDASFVENAFYTEPFKQVLLKPNHTEVRVAAPANATHLLKAKAPLLARDQTLCLLGNTPALANWNTAAPVLLSRSAGEDFLSVKLDLSDAAFPLAYKYGVYDVDRSAFVRYEDGNNRMLRERAEPGRKVIVNDGFARLPAATWKGAGVNVPVFSLRSRTSFGVGEFTDLKMLADWCEQTGLKLIQLLPVNDTTATHTWRDSYPYSAISAFALHPLYLNLDQVATGRNRGLLEELAQERRRLNALPNLDYEQVMNVKMAFLRRIYPSERVATIQSESYQRFFDRNRPWLVPYAVFCALRDKYGTADFNQWPGHRACTKDEIDRLGAADSELSEEIGRACFIQYHLHAQLQEAAAYAHSKGIVLKGDIPIGVCRYGADAWQEPALYHMDMQAGAPPDAFSAKGQNWEFPTYNWLRMEEDRFGWWRRRFGQMSCYFDAFRIDHILGFFRIWSIPVHAVEGILGFFVPALPVHASEFEARGVWFDPDRYTQPHITERLLEGLFGPDGKVAKASFLQAAGPGHYRLKGEFDTQRKVERHFAGLPETEQNEKIRQGLYDLISNVLLLEVESSGADEFHFRLGIENTPSFRSLDRQTQARLRELYVDYFYRRQDDFWRKEALRKLPVLKRATNMLVCGEDLGMVPACVPGVMKQLGLLSLEVQRMPKGLGQDFSRPKDAPYLSVVTPSTHDMSTIRGWWEEDPGRIQKFYNEELGRPGQAPRRCEPWINEAMVLQHLAAPAMWSIFLLQDLVGMDEHLRRSNPAEERINIPANPKHYWRYRMHLRLEDLLEAQGLNRKLRTLIQQSGR